VINEIRKRGIPAFAGKYDQGIGLMSDAYGVHIKQTWKKTWAKFPLLTPTPCISAKTAVY
jgi:hypothetical protein